MPITQINRTKNAGNLAEGENILVAFKGLELTGGQHIRRPFPLDRIVIAATVVFA